MCTVLVTYDANNEIAQNLIHQLSRTKGVEFADDVMPIERVIKRKRIPISEIYWEKGDYEELVKDPFNLIGLIA
jgi:hypothetical protein